MSQSTDRTSAAVAPVEIEWVDLACPGLPTNRLARVHLPPTAEPSDAAPVRIFLGTEPAQQQAERIFVWSILACRDPARRYEITLMRDLEGFRRFAWATGFSNYRFAIPHLAQGRGRWIYNDVDQVYLRDPGELFDLELGDAGYAAIGPRETSVMLLDAAKMAPVWPMAEVLRGRRRALVDRAVARPELFREIDPAWNTRDEDGIAADDAFLYHFTTLHTQPWRPFPDRFVYHEHPDRELWWKLRRAADAAGFHVFSARHPSADFAARSAAESRLAESELRKAADALGRTSVERAWLVGATPADARRLAESSGVECDALPLSALREAPDPRDAVLCFGSLLELASDDVPWVLKALFDRAGHWVHVAGRARRWRTVPRWQPAIGGAFTETWWQEQMQIASAGRPAVQWQLELAASGRGAAPAVLRGGAWPGERGARVWLVGDGTPASDAALDALATALAGAPGFEPARLPPLSRRPDLSSLWRDPLGLSVSQRSRWSAAQRDALASDDPPELVVTCGRTLVGAARDARTLSSGRTRAVHLDIDRATPVRGLDLVVTPALQAPLAEPRRLELAVPLRPPVAERASSRSEGIAVVLEGTRFEVLGPEIDRWATELAEGLRKRCEAGEDSIPRRVVAHASVSRALVERVARELGAAEGTAVEWLRFADADELVRGIGPGERALVACEGDAILAALVASGVELELAPLPPRPAPRPKAARRAGAVPGLRGRVARSASRRPGNDRGTTRPQIGLETIASMLLAEGVATDAPAPARRADRLIERGLARSFGGDGAHAAPQPSGEVERVVERLRETLEGRAVGLR